MELLLVLTVLGCTIGAIIAVALSVYHFFGMIQGIRSQSEWWVNLIPFIAFALPGALTDEGKSRGAKAVSWGALAAAFVLVAIVARYVAEGAA